MISTVPYSFLYQKGNLQFFKFPWFSANHYGIIKISHRGASWSLRNMAKWLLSWILICCFSGCREVNYEHVGLLHSVPQGKRSLTFCFDLPTLLGRLQCWWTVSLHQYCGSSTDFSHFCTPCNPISKGIFSCLIFTFFSFKIIKTIHILKIIITLISAADRSEK